MKLRWQLNMNAVKQRKHRQMCMCKAIWLFGVCLCSGLIIYFNSLALCITWLDSAEKLKYLVNSLSVSNILITVTNRATATTLTQSLASLLSTNQCSAGLKWFQTLNQVIWCLFMSQRRKSFRLLIGTIFSFRNFCFWYLWLVFFPIFVVRVLCRDYK